MTEDQSQPPASGSAAPELMVSDFAALADRASADPSRAASDMSKRAGRAHGRDDLLEATRLMCVAAYVDARFAQDVVDEVVDERHRAVHVPSGIDIRVVASHCLAACRQKQIRDYLLSADLVLTVILLLATRSVVVFALGFVLAWGVVFWDRWSSTYRVVLQQLNRRVFDPGAAPAAPSARLATRLEELARLQRGNLFVYSGFSPFSGWGLTRDGWSFLIDLRKGKDGAFGERATADDLSVADLYSGITKALLDLSLPNLQMRDCLFVSGADVRDDQRVLPPKADLEAEALATFMTDPTHQMRHYRCVEILDWGGELVVSLFLRFAIANNRLFCELNRFVLLPLNEDLHRVDQTRSRAEARDLMAMAITSAALTPGLSLRAPRVIVRPLGRSRKESRRTRDIEKDASFDYGAATTALHRIRSTRYRRYFQLLDWDRHEKVLERTVLDTIVEILDEHGIDTGELAERRSMIINNGIMMNKDTNLQAGNLAIGEQAGIHIKLPGAARRGRSGSEAPVGP
jgi:hypothetical protein